MTKYSALIALIVGALLASACAGPEVPPSTTPISTTPPANNETIPPAVPPTTPPVDNATPPAVITPPAQSPQQGPHEVWIQGFSFNPPILTVDVGTTVMWTNKDGDLHDVYSDPPGIFGQQLPGSGGTASHTFNQAGTYNYVCTLHAGMSGTIVVK